MHLIFIFLLIPIPNSLDIDDNFTSIDIKNSFLNNFAKVSVYPNFRYVKSFQENEELVTRDVMQSVPNLMNKITKTMLKKIYKYKEERKKKHKRDKN